MNSKELKAKLVEAGLSEEKASELSDYVMKNNGVDINREKERNAEELANVKDELETSKKNYAELEEKNKAYADYEELKKYKQDALMKEEQSHKGEFLKSIGLKDDKYANLMLTQLDFTKGVYDADKKTYTGMDDGVKALKEAYPEMFAKESKPTGIQPDSNGSSGTEKLGWETILENRRKGNI